MRIAGALVLIVLAMGSAAADRERPVERDVRPCRCLRPTPIHAELETRPRDAEHAAQVVARIKHGYNRGIHACLHHRGIPDAKLVLTFARGATTPRVRATPIAPARSSTRAAPDLAGARSCLERITFHSFATAKRATTLRVFVSSAPRPIAR